MMTSSENPIPHNHARPGVEFLGIGIVLLTAIGFFYPLLFDGKVIFYRDYNLITYPYRYFLGQTFNQGAIPYWIQHSSGGMPFMAAFHPGVFYPPSLLFFLDDTTYALNLFYVMHFMIMGVFTFLLARCWNISLIAALCCGITAMLSGFIIASTLVSNFFMSAVWLPMVFWMFHRFWTRRHRGYFVGLVLAIAIQTLAACPEISAMTLLLLTAHSLYFLPRSPGFAGMARMAVALVSATLLALGLSALQLLPTAQLVKHSFRSGGLSYDDHAGWSMKPDKLLTLLVSPDYEGHFERPLYSMQAFDASDSMPDNGTSSGPVTAAARPPDKISELATLNSVGFLQTYYMGLIGAFFVFMGFLFRREKAVMFWLVVFLIGVFLAFGKYNPVYKIIYYAVPFLSLFRYPEKFIFISTFATVFLTGYGLDCLMRYTRERRLKLFLIPALLMILIGVIGWRASGKISLSPEYSMGILAAFGLTWVMLYLGKIKETGFAVLVLLMIFVDLSNKGPKLLPLIDRQYYEEKPILLDALGESSGKYRIYSGKLYRQPDLFNRYPLGPTPLAQILASKEQLIPYMGLVHGLEYVDGYIGLALTLKKNFLWLQVFSRSPPERRRRILARSNVKYWIDGDTLTDYVKDYPVILPDRVEIFKDALPRAYLVPHMRVPGEGHVLNTYYRETFDPLKEVLLKEAVDFAPSDRFQGTVEAVSYRPNHVTVQTSQEGNGFLVLMDSYFPGWTVTVDGEQRPILRANHYYRAVQLGPGEHTLEFDYFPEGFKAGLVISGVTFVLGLAGCVWGRNYLQNLK